jgi:hypothetical protein
MDSGQSTRPRRRRAAGTIRRYMFRAGRNPVAVARTPAASGGGEAIELVQRLVHAVLARVRAQPMQDQRGRGRSSLNRGNDANRFIPCAADHVGLHRAIQDGIQMCVAPRTVELVQGLLVHAGDATWTQAWAPAGSVRTPVPGARDRMVALWTDPAVGPERSVDSGSRPVATAPNSTIRPALRSSMSQPAAE